MKGTSFGISIEPSWPQAECLKLAIRAEKFGLSNVWVPDGGVSSPFSDTIVTLAAIASNTNKIKFGSAILNFYTRNPAQIASSFLALSDLGFLSSKSQRAILGIGLGSHYNVSKFGIFSRKGMVQNLREAIESIQQLFKGEEVSIRTDPFSIERVRLSKCRGKIPIYVGSSSPKGLRLSGEISDGIILTERIASEIQEKLKHVELGLAYSSRKRKDLELVNLEFTSRQIIKRRKYGQCLALLRGLPSSRTKVLLGAFAFKSLASGITIYTVTAGTAVELAPASSILMTNLGIVSGSIIVNMIWLCAVIGSFYLIQKMVPDGKIKRLTLKIALFFIMVIAAFDGLWDLAVLLRFNELYVISIVALSATLFSLYALRRYSGFHPKAFER